MKSFHNDDKIKYPPHAKAEKAVVLCKAHLEELGFIVSNPKDASANGHDLVAIKNGCGITVEVKAAFYSARMWKVSRVSKITSDLVAIVFPSGKIHINSMQDHLKTCSKTGARALTCLGNVYE